MKTPALDIEYYAAANSGLNTGHETLLVWPSVSLEPFLCALDNVLLDGLVQAYKIGRITRDANDQTSVFFWLTLRAQKRLPTDNIELHLHSAS
jgi:hypothetical protein